MTILYKIVARKPATTEHSFVFITSSQIDLYKLLIEIQDLTQLLLMDSS